MIRCRQGLLFLQLSWVLQSLSLSVLMFEGLGIAWIDGQVEEINGDEVSVQTLDGKTLICRCNGLELGVLQNVAIRYQLNRVCTYTRSILIAINPFQRLPDLYDAHIMEQYEGALLGELSLHVFTTTDVTFRAMMNEGKSDSTLVSGESDASKTKTAWMLMQYLAYLGSHKGAKWRTIEHEVFEI